MPQPRALLLGTGVAVPPIRVDNQMLSRIVDMVAKAQRSRAPIQRLADQVAGWFVPTVILFAIAAFVAWAMFGRSAPGACRESRSVASGHSRACGPAQRG